MFSFLCLYLIAPALADIALGFQAPDLFSLVFFGLTIICGFAAKSLIKGLLSAAIGLLIVTVGQDPVMGTARFTFGNVNMLGGIHFLTAMIGLFAIPQIVDNLGRKPPAAGAGKVGADFGNLLPRLAELKRMLRPVSIGSITGAFLGILPGVGGPIAARRRAGIRQ
jgi:putative tricarboxylic transport membrane protein